MEQLNSKLNEGHTVGVEQKIWELKEELRNFKRIKKKHKSTVKPNEALKKETVNMNIQPTVEYGVAPKEVKKSL